MHDGRDRLLEYSSCRQGKANELAKRIEYYEQQSELKDLVSTLFDCYGINIEEHKPGSYIISPAEHMIGQFPGLDDDGMTITFDRKTATTHDDMHFLSWDHPMVLNGFDMLLGNETGNTSVCSLKHPEIRPGQLLIQAFFIVDCEIPLQYQHVFRPQMLQPLPVILASDEQHQDLGAKIDRAEVNSLDRKISKEIIKLKKDDIADIVKRLTTRLDEQVEDLLQQHYAGNLLILSREIERLEKLKKINPQVREDEVDFFVQQQDALEAIIKHPSIRLDAIRVMISI